MTYQPKRTKNYDTKTERQQHSTSSYNAIICMVTATPQQLHDRLKRTQKHMSLILRGNTTSTSTEKRPVSSLRSGLATECCEYSFMKSSRFPAAGPFSGAVLHGGQFNITMKLCKQVTNFHLSLNTVNFRLAFFVIFK